MRMTFDREDMRVSTCAIWLVPAFFDAIDLAHELRACCAQFAEFHWNFDVEHMHVFVL